ncbi:hypothetical protein [Roseateles sp.]|uniref:hypothetical protein n=1 Tax=Roseateles sp. TaxID=1971397 RepID=UPI00286A2842|nr:hypothetical protein [Roseateles sp.]
MDHLACFTPKDLPASGAPPPDLAAYRWRLLAQGDSWFSTATAKLNAHANLLQEMVFKQPTCAVNCAGSGDALSHMVDLASAPDFVRLLSAADAPVWDGVLLSVGGNDLISAAQTPAHTADGAEVPLHLRLLRRQTEWGPPSAGVARYFSEPGWATYSDYLRTNVRHLLTLRDQGPSAGKPVFMHCYAVPMPRPADAASCRHRGQCQLGVRRVRPLAVPSAEGLRAAQRRLGGGQPFDGVPSGAAAEKHGGGQGTIPWPACVRLNRRALGAGDGRHQWQQRRLA